MIKFIPTTGINGNQIQGILLLVLGILTGSAATLPLMTQGKMGITVSYLSAYTDFSWLAAAPMGLFAVVGVAIVAGGALIVKRTRAGQFWLLFCGMTGLLLTAVGITESTDHIIAFRNACSALQLEAADMNAPIRLGWGGVLNVGSYLCMTLSGLLPIED